MGIRTGDKRGAGKSPRDVAKKAQEAIGIHSPLPQVLPFSSSLVFAFRHLGGMPAAIEAARLVSEKDERFAQLVHMYDEVAESNKSKLKLEVMCSTLGITSGEFLGATSAALYDRNIDIGNLIAAANHPKVVEATVENATRANGFMDRQMLHQHHQFLPQAKGTQINIDNSKKILNAGGAPQQQIPEGDGGVTRIGLPSFEEETISATRAIRGDAGMGSVGQKLLPPATPEQAVTVPEVIDAEVVE